MSIHKIFGSPFLKYLMQRVGQCLLVIFIGITITFFIPRLAPTNPVEQKNQPDDDWPREHPS